MAAYSRSLRAKLPSASALLYIVYFTLVFSLILSVIPHVSAADAPAEDSIPIVSSSPQPTQDTGTTSTTAIKKISDTPKSVDELKVDVIPVKPSDKTWGQTIKGWFGFREKTLWEKVTAGAIGTLASFFDILSLIVASLALWLFTKIPEITKKYPMLGFFKYLYGNFFIFGIAYVLFLLPFIWVFPIPGYLLIWPVYTFRSAPVLVCGGIETVYVIILALLWARRKRIAAAYRKNRRDRAAREVAAGIEINQAAGRAAMGEEDVRAD